MTVTGGALAPQPSNRPAPRPAPRPATRPARRPSSRISRVAFTEGLAAIVIGGGLLLATAGAAATVTQAGYRLDHARRVLASVQDGEQRLAVQVAQLQAPTRLAAIASGQLGMAAPASFETVQPVPVQNVSAPRARSAVVAIAQTKPPGSVLTLWRNLRAFVAHMR